ncbi:MAG: oligosaccharide flippase family protein [Chitinophagaceae bacterium]
MLRKLLGETLWYGMPTILGRFLSYLLVFFHVRWFGGAEYGVISNMYAVVTFLSILCTFGMETSYFRFVHDYKQKTFNNALLVTTVISSLVIIVLMSLPSLQAFIVFGKEVNPIFMKKVQPCIYYLLGILFFDTLSVIPFCQLRFQEKARKYACLKALNIVIIIGMQLILLFTPLLNFIPVKTKIEYIFIANFIASFCVVLMLFPIWKEWKPQIDKVLLKKMLLFSFFIFVANMGGMVNETLDRILLPRYYAGSFSQGMFENGIYAAAYKLSIMITLFVQAFRLAAEPFFFKQLKYSLFPEKIYAMITKWFTIGICIIFLVLMLFLNIWQYLIVNKQHPEYIEGLKVVGILALANIFLGIYYNISIWYKVKQQTYAGGVIAVSAALITIIGNIVLIPKYSYVACAWVTFFSYLFMVVVVYTWGQKKYPVPYPIKTMIFYLLFAVVIYAIYIYVETTYFFVNFLIGILFLAIYVGIVFIIEERHIIRIFKKNK